MAGEAPGPSGQRIQQQPILVIPDVANNVKNNFSIQTGEEFSMKFLQDRVAATKVPIAPDMAQTREKKILFNYDQNGHIVYEGLTGILGLRRMDSECASDMSEYASARESVKELENGACNDKSIKCHSENDDAGHASRKAFGELKGDGTGLGPMAPPIYKSDSPHSNNYSGSGVSDGLSGKMKLLCSFGGKILPRPSDGKLRYVGGQTHIISIQKNITREELVKKTSGICNQLHTIKYQLPGEDLDALISVSSDEDLQNMIEEYNGLERHEGSPRLRIFLIPLGESDKTPSYEGNIIQQGSPDYQYVVAVNGVQDPIPGKNTGGQSLVSEACQLGPNSDCNPSFHRNSPNVPVQLEIKGGYNALHPAHFFNQLQYKSRSPDPSPPISPVPLQGGDLRSAHLQLNGDHSCHDSNDSSISFFTVQLPPENSDTNGADCKHPLQRMVPLMNHLHPYRQVDVSQPDQPSGGYFHKHNPVKEFVISVADQNDNDMDRVSCERSMHKERTFHSERPISCPEDPLGLFSGSCDSIDSHRGMPHAFSDSKLHENGGSSAYCSQEGMSPLSPFNFPKAQLSPLLNSSATQEKPLKLDQNVDLVCPRVQYKLVDVDSTGSQTRLDLLNSSICSEISGRNETIYMGTGGIDDKYQTAEEDLGNSGFITTKHLKENYSTLENMARFNEKHPLLCQDGKLCEERSPATGLECKKIFPNINSNLFPFGVDSSTQELQVSGHVLPASTAIEFQTFVDSLMERPQDCQLEKSPVMSLRTDGDEEDFVLTITVGGEQGKKIPETANSEVAGLYPSARVLSCDENSFSDLISGSSCVLASFEPPLLQPVASQREMGPQEPMLKRSADLCPSAYHDDSGLCSNMNTSDHTVIQNPTENTSVRREFSLLDADFVNYPDKEIKNLGFGGPVSEKSNVEDQSLERTQSPRRSHHKNYVELLIVEDVNETIHPCFQSSATAVPLIPDEISSNIFNILSPTATDGEGSINPEFESEARLLET